MLQSFAYSGGQDDAGRIFGAGAHACLGRQLSVDLWSAFTRRLSQSSARVAILDYALRKNDYIFTYPAKLSIALQS